MKIECVQLGLVEYAQAMDDDRLAALHRAQRAGDGEVAADVDAAAGSGARQRELERDGDIEQEYIACDPGDVEDEVAEHRITGYVERGHLLGADREMPERGVVEDVDEADLGRRP